MEELPFFVILLYLEHNSQALSIYLYQQDIKTTVGSVFVHTKGCNLKVQNRQPKCHHQTLTQKDDGAFFLYFCKAGSQVTCFTLTPPSQTFWMWPSTTKPTNFESPGCVFLVQIANSKTYFYHLSRKVDQTDTF